jgi:hypothetical protein
MAERDLPRRHEGHEGKIDKRKPQGFVDLLDEAIALVPANDVEISMLERYGADRWKERMIQVREKLLALRDHAAAAPDRPASGAAA